MDSDTMMRMQPNRVGCPGQEKRPIDHEMEILERRITGLKDVVGKLLHRIERITSPYPRKQESYGTDHACSCQLAIEIDAQSSRIVEITSEIEEVIDHLDL